MPLGEDLVQTFKHWHCPGLLDYPSPQSGCIFLFFAVLVVDNRVVVSCFKAVFAELFISLIFRRLENVSCQSLVKFL